MTLAEKRLIVNDCQSGLSLPLWKIRGLSSHRSPVLRMVADVSQNVKPLPPFKAGDTFYVKEAWALEDPENPDSKIIYKSDLTRPDLEKEAYKRLSWNPPASMPRLYARSFYQVSSVKLEQLHDAKVDDLLREGLPNCKHFNDCFKPCQLCTRPCSPKHQYRKIWNKVINEQKSQLYEANPWTWVIYLTKLT